MSEIGLQQMYAGGPMTEADWSDDNPLLDRWQIGFVVDAATGLITKAKVGDGTHRWNDLSYFDPSGNGVKVYRALLTQTGTDAPVATVLENTLGFTPVWTYEDEGSYKSANAGYAEGQTAVFGTPVNGLSLGTSDGFVNITTQGDGALSIWAITILVYPS